jgi:hypothetical protein
MNQAKKLPLFSLFYEGRDRDTQTIGSFLKNFFLAAMGLGGFVMGMTLLFMAMRGVMDLGGFVASGGPYQIAHQAPDWIWVFPVSIIGGVIFLFVYSLFARRIGGIKWIALAWPALFISLGYNFLAYAFNPPGSQQGVVFGWLIPGILFEIIGGLPLLIILRETFRYLKHWGVRKRQPLESSQTLQRSDEDYVYYLPGALVSFMVFILNTVGVAASIYLALAFFEHLTS